jgi:hypothetical protein
LLFIRWVFVIRKEMIEGIALAEAEAQRITSSLDADLAKKYRATRTAIQKLLDRARSYRTYKHTGMLGWSGSYQIATSTVIHEAERQSVWLMPDDLVIARLIQVGGHLSDIPEPRRDEWSSAYKSLIVAGQDDRRLSPEQMTRRRVFLSEFLGEQYAFQDARLGRLYDLYNKTFWLIIVSLVPIGALIGLGYALILSAGAIGGIISRMQNVVFAKQLPTSFATSWNPLFCAPILGALAAWSGLALLRLLQVLGIANLSDILPGDDAVTNPTLPVMGLAVLFGLSERFLNTLGDQAQAAISVGGSTSVPSTEVIPVFRTPAPAASSSDGHAQSPAQHTE